MRMLRFLKITVAQQRILCVKWPRNIISFFFVSRPIHRFFSLFLNFFSSSIFADALSCGVGFYFY